MGIVQEVQLAYQLQIYCGTKPNTWKALIATSTFSLAHYTLKQTWPWVKMDVPTAFNGWYPTQDKLGWMDTQVFVWMDGLPGWLVM